MSVILKVENVSIQYKTGDFKDIGLKEWVIKHIKRQYKVVNFYGSKPCDV